MCTKEEVRQVIRSEVTPAWMRYTLGLMGTGILMLLAWLLFNSTQQDKILADFRTVNKVAMASLTGKMDLLNNKLTNLKEVAVNRSQDRYTGTEARAKNELFELKCKQNDKEHTEINRKVNELDLKLDKLFK